MSQELCCGAIGTTYFSHATTTMRHLATIFAVLIGLCFWGYPTHDPDLGWHLFGGAYVAQHHWVPISDPINSFNEFWFDYHWAGQLLFYEIFSLGGYEGLRLFLGALMALLCLVLLDIIRIVTRNRASPLSEMLYLSFAIASLTPLTSVRPQMIALLGIALALRTLLQHQRPRQELLFLLLLSTVLVNIHVYWIFIPFLFACFRLLPRLVRRRHASALYGYGGFTLLALTGFLSPYTLAALSGEGSYPWQAWGNYYLLLDYLLGSHELKSMIHEFKGALEAPFPLPYLLVLYCILVCRRVRRKRILVTLPRTFSGLLSLLLSFRAVKFVGLFSIVGLPLLIRSSHGLRSSLDTWVRKAPRIAATMTLAPILLAAWGCWSLSPMRYQNGALMSENLPITACAQLPLLEIPRAADRDHLRVLTFFDYGGWCRWASFQSDPQFAMRVTTDGRTQLVPVEHYLRSFDLYRLNYDWSKTLALWDPDVALVEKGRALGEFLSRAPQFWRLVYEDGRFALLVPQRAPPVTKLTPHEAPSSALP